MVRFNDFLCKSHIRVCRLYIQNNMLVEFHFSNFRHSKIIRGRSLNDPMNYKFELYPSHALMHAMGKWLLNRGELFKVFQAIRVLTKREE